MGRCDREVEKSFFFIPERTGLGQHQAFPDGAKCRRWGRVVPPGVSEQFLLNATSHEKGQGRDVQEVKTRLATSKGNAALGSLEEMSRQEIVRIEGSLPLWQADSAYKTAGRPAGPRSWCIKIENLELRGATARLCVWACPSCWRCHKLNGFIH